jgi:hypothetical protein
MSQLASTLLATAAGALLAYLFGYFRRVRGEFEEQAGPLHDVKRELASARQIIANALASKRLWPDSQKLCSSAWDKWGGQLSSRLEDRDRSEIQGVFALLHNTDQWARKLRQERSELESRAPAAFVNALGIIEQKLDGAEGAIGILDKKLSKAESTLRHRRIAGLAMVALAVAVIAVPAGVSYVSKPAVTETSLSRQLHERFPASTRAICDKSSIFDGTYRCAVEFPSCHGHLEASIEEQPSCSAPGPRVDVLKVYADDDCYEATMFERILSELPSSQSESKPTKNLTSSGCVED